MRQSLDALQASGESIAESTVYKGTTLPHVVVKRHLQLHRNGFTTYQSEKGVGSGKFWRFHRRCQLDPPDAAQIKAHERHLRKAGPLRAVSAYVRDKNVLKLYCYRVEWPDKHAPSHGSVVELGFDSLAQARHWHGLMAAQLQALVSFNSQASSASPHTSSSGGGARGASNGGGRAQGQWAPCGPSGGETRGTEETFSAVGSPDSSMPNTPLPVGKPPLPPHGGSLSALATPSPRDSSAGGGAHAAHGAAAAAAAAGLASAAAPAGGSGGGGASDAAAAGRGQGRALASSSSMASSRWSSGDDGGAPLEDGRAVLPTFGSLEVTESVRATLQASSIGAGHSSGVVDDRGDDGPAPRSGGGGGGGSADEGGEDGDARSSDGGGDGDGEESGSAGRGSPGQRKGDGGGGGSSSPGLRLCSSPSQELAASGAAIHSAVRSAGGASKGGADGPPSARVVVDQNTMRWVPYKHSNGMAIYYRHTPRSERGAGVLRQGGGEYMLSVAVAASPERCVAALQSPRSGRGGCGGVVSVASHMEVLEDNGDVQVRHMVFHPAGSAGTWGTLCAPREAFMRQVLTSYEEGVYNILFDSVPDHDIKQEWRERAAASARSATNAARASDPTASGRWWASRRVRAKITGAFTLSALEGKGSRDSPQTLVTTILRADFGGWLSPASIFFQFGWAFGLQEAFMDRLLMTVMILREEVEYSRFRTKPFQLLMCAANSASEPRGTAAGGGGGGALPATPPAHHQRHFSQGAPLAPSLASGPVSGGSLSLPRAEALASAVSAVSAAASALAAHMTEPHQLWSRGAGAGAAGGQPDGAAAAGPGQPPGVVEGAAPGKAVPGAPAASAPRAVSFVKHGAPAAAAEARGVTAAALIEAAAEEAAAQRAAADSGLAPSPRFSAADLEAYAGGTMHPDFWEPIHVPGAAQVFSIRGPNYLRDRKKIPAGTGRFRLLACDLAATPSVVSHVARFLPSVRLSGCPFMFVVNLLIPGTGSNPCLHLVMVFGAPTHPSSLGACPDDPLDAGPEWTPFDFTLSRFLHSTDYERNGTFKLIPHCAKGSWILCQTVGTTPVILGRKLPTTSYVLTDRYIEVDVNVATNPAVSYVVSMVQGATKSMVIDHAYLLEGHFSHELPEALVGAVRFKHLDMGQYVYLDTDHEVLQAPVDPNWK